MMPRPSKYRRRRNHLAHDAIWRVLRTGRAFTTDSVARELYGHLHKMHAHLLRPVVRQYARAGLLEQAPRRRPGWYRATTRREFTPSELHLQDLLEARREKGLLREGLLRDRLLGVLRLPAAAIRCSGAREDYFDMETDDSWLT